jgi:hypothetical protein
MGFLILLPCAILLAAAPPVKPAEAKARQVLPELGSPSDVLGSTPWLRERFINRKETAGTIDLDLGQQVTTFALHKFGDTIEERTTGLHDVATASLLLVERRKLFI